MDQIQVDAQCPGEHMKIRDWLIHLPTDAIRSAINAYTHAYDAMRSEARDAGVETGGVWESSARRKADIAFIEAMISLIPKENQIRTNGLFRCCIQTAEEYGPGTEGQILPCRWCVEDSSNRMVWHNDAWQRVTSPVVIGVDVCKRKL